MTRQSLSPATQRKLHQFATLVLEMMREELIDLVLEDPRLVLRDALVGRLVRDADVPPGPEQYSRLAALAQHAKALVLSGELAAREQHEAAVIVEAPDLKKPAKPEKSRPGKAAKSPKADPVRRGNRHARYLRAKATGMCVSHPNRPAVVGHTRCEECRDLARARDVRRRDRQRRAQLSAT